ncbi:hypothetical protein N7454_004456 [Penicillium verhagenii]|nr:hypothetical protein N7454_004456 [Penicillium verhagenii]
MTMRSRHVQSPHSPIGLRSEHIAEFERLLWIQPKYDPHSPDEFQIKYDSDDSTLIAVTGTKYQSGRRVREFRDASGLPMFEAQAERSLWKKKPWRIRLPGSTEGDGEDLAKLKRKGMQSNFDLTFRNALAEDAKTDSERMVTLEVRSANAGFGMFGIWAAGRKVADVRQSVTRNRTVSSSLSMGTSWKGAYSQPTRSIMEILVADGFDFCLVSFSNHLFFVASVD